MYIQRHLNLENLPISKGTHPTDGKLAIKINVNVHERERGREGEGDREKERVHVIDVHTQIQSFFVKKKTHPHTHEFFVTPAVLVG